MPAPKGPGKAPTSVLDTLHAAAPRKEVNSCIPVRMYYRSAVNLQRQAEQYKRARNNEQQYLMLLRFVSLVLETIPRHSDYKKNDPDYVRLRSTSTPLMEELERLKLQISLVDRDNPYLPTNAPGAVKFGPGTDSLSSFQQQIQQRYGTRDSDALDGLGSPEWAAMIASQGNANQQTALPLPATSKLMDMPDLTPTLALPPASRDMLSKHSLGGTLPLPPSTSNAAYGDNTGAASRPSAPSYNELLASLDINSGAVAALAAAARPSPYAGQLQLGPQELHVHTAPYLTGPLPPGSTCCPPPNSSSSTGSTSTTSATTALDKPPSGTGGVAEVRKRQRIRDVHLSASLMKEFLRYADSNTRRGIETCGILAGALSPDDARFTITALIIPKQEGTTDTVQALAEEEIFEVQDSRALYPLGWIHTHPTQTCFLSSIDVHTHCGYQTMLDEAVAIVMAPSQPRQQMGVFRLTTPGGLSLVQQCPLRGFHAHPPTSTGQPLYEQCSNVYLNERIGYEVIDLRSYR